MTQTYSIPLPLTETTVAHMGHFARTGSKNLEIRYLAEDIVKGIQGKDYVGEGLAVCHWLDANYRYTRDIAGVELLKHPTEALRHPMLDCDECACLIAALLLSIGHRVAFVTVGFGNGDFSHVFCQALDQRSGRWIVLDPVAAPDVRGMLRRVRKYRIYPV